MAANALRDVLNRLRWHEGERGAAATLAVRVRRGGGEAIIQHSFADVAEISARGVTLHDGTFLPFHRVVAVSLDDRLVWPRREAR